MHFVLSFRILCLHRAVSLYRQLYRPSRSSSSQGPAVADHFRAVKSAKKILASERDNPHLWDGYARLERQRGNISAARTVYSTALQVSRQSGTSDPKLVWKESDYELLWSWVEMEYFEAEEARAMRVLLIGAEIDLDYLQKLEASDSPPSALDLLKARQVCRSTTPVPD